jgi:hypothetical protein
MYGATRPIPATSGAVSRCSSAASGAVVVYTHDGVVETETASPSAWALRTGPEVYRHVQAP